MDIETIHESLVNGQRRQMVEQIDEYGLYAFWRDYVNFLDRVFFYTGALEAAGLKEMNAFLSDAVISYHRIKNR